MEAGEGPALVHLHGAGGMRLNPSHDLLARRFRVIVFEMPGFGTVENERTQTMPELAATMAAAVESLGLGRTNLMGTSFGGKVALWFAVQRPELISAVVLEAPAAIRPRGSRPASGTPEEIARMLYAHPERMPPIGMSDPDQAARITKFVRRLAGPDRDAALEDRMRQIQLPVLAVFGTRDRMMPPEMGRLYKEFIPNAHLVFVYDAGHAIASERPEAFVEVVGDFLEREDAFVISREKSVLMP
jgi:2-hydroxy-6-oxonona-2,4-dienedioate hydrolase/4,5:9,10-diseco-3-hydroxy-5,9,17-trioxoandrosta-1(10),2-diene-4-oate hydrolase